MDESDIIWEKLHNANIETELRKKIEELKKRVDLEINYTVQLTNNIEDLKKAMEPMSPIPHRSAVNWKIIHEKIKEMGFRVIKEPSPPKEK